MADMSAADTSGGQPIIVSGRLYHSRHAPDREAERFLAGLSLDGRKVCILVAPGAHHLETAVKARLPDCRIYSLQPALFRGRPGPAPGGTEWFEDSGIGLETQLSDWLDDEDAGTIEMVVWPPAWQHFPQFCADCATAITAFIKEASANLQTCAHFGRRWLANAVGNLLNVHAVTGLGKSAGVVVLAGSGPGLLDCRDLLQAERAHYSLWALPSSLRALGAWGLVPDVLVTSDAGYWAAEHLRWLGTRHAGETLVIAPLRAMLRPLWSRAFPTAFVSFDLNLEADLLDLRFVPGAVPSLLDRGTVAATALDLLERCHDGPVISLGLDFAWRDLEPHVVPHTFDEQKWCAAGRLAGFAHRRYAEREAQPSVALASGWRQTPPLDIYQRWMDRAGYGGRLDIFDYNPSIVAKGLPEVGLPEIKRRLARSGKPRIARPSDVPPGNGPEHRQAIAGFLRDTAERLLSSGTDLAHPGNFYRSLCPKAWQEYRLGHVAVLELNRAAASFMQRLSMEADACP